MLIENHQFALKAVLASLAWSIPLTIIIALAFCFLRPYNNVVYAPRAKHADSKHAPPVVPKGLFGWILPLIRTKEPELIEKVGLDAVVFMRFCRMMRNIFSILSVIGCVVLIPVNVIAGNKSNAPTDPGTYLMRATPQYMGTGDPLLWAYVVVAYVFTLVVFFFLWLNYKAVFRLRREYFDSSEYQRSLHARTLLLTDVPKELRTDDGIVRITEQVKSTNDVPRAAIARNVKDLPDLVEEHEETVRRLEKHLARYLKNPDKLPPKRPTCKVNTNDKTYKKGQQVDAIEYLTARIKELEIEIKQAREVVDKRNALSYGFASYDSIAEAHGVAHAARKKGPHQTMIRLAPRPTDLVWKNLALSKKARSRNNFINNLWVALLTIVWVGPNIMIAVFLSNLTNIGGLWPAFQDSLEKYPKSWALVQGIGAPLLTTLFYLYLPAIFRRLCVNGGDLAKTSRERHVTHKLYAFFVFNNLIVFSLFSALFKFISAVVSDDTSGNFYEKARQAHAFKNIVNALCAVSPYWISWLLQRNLGKYRPMLG
nr:uncharacterized protein CFP56_62923 [Quercus suber]